MTEEEFQKIHANAGGPFVDYLFALRDTGARPNEARDLLWSHVQPDRWVLTKHKTSRKVQKDRVVILTDAMQAMMERLKGNGHTHVFLNTEGQPWTKNAVRLQMTRLREKLGLADDLCAYLARHGFGTRAILNGVNPPVVAELMGHNSLEMVSKVYVHLADEHAYLKAAVEKISRPVQNGMSSRTAAIRRSVATHPKRLTSDPGLAVPAKSCDLKSKSHERRTTVQAAIAAKSSCHQTGIGESAIRPQHGRNA